MAKTHSTVAPTSLMKHVAVPLTPRERQEKHDELVRTLNDLERLHEHFAMLKQQHKATVKSRELTIRELSHDLKDNYVMRSVSCEERPDLDAGTMTTTRLDTRDIVDTRPLTEKEREAASKAQGPAGAR